MIPLNRPFFENISKENSFIHNFEHKGFYCRTLYSSRDGLNAIYSSLYKERGPLRVAVSPLTCFVALYPIINNGHIPVFVDINANTFNIEETKLNETKVDVIQIIHLGGNPVNINPIITWADCNNIIVIEDCAQALGSTYEDRLVGTFGDYTVYSLLKNLYAPYGALMISKKEIEINILHTTFVKQTVLYYKKIKKYLESKLSYKDSIYSLLLFSLLKIKSENLSISYDGRIKLIDPSIDIIGNLYNLDKIVEKRLEVADTIIKNVDSTKFLIQEELPNAKSNRNRLIFRSNFVLAKNIINSLRKAGIAANNLTQNYLCGFQESISDNAYLNKYYDKLDNYEELNKYIFSIPCSPGLRENEINYIIKTLNKL